MTNEPKAPGAPAIILFREVDRDDRTVMSRERSGPWFVKNAAHENVYFRIKILTEAGRKYADIEIPYTKNETTIVDIQARSIKPDGTIVNFNGKAFDKTIAKARGISHLAKTFTLPEAEVGGVIEYFYTINLSQRPIFDSHWILSEDLFTKQARFSLNPSSGLELRWTWHDLPTGVQPVIEPNRVVSLEVRDIPAFETEDFMPPADEQKARVDFVYSNKGDTFADDPDKYWKEFGKESNDLLEAFVGKGKGMDEAVAAIVSPGDAPEVKLEKIYARVQQLRNLSFEAEQTEQEQKRKKEKWPTNVEEVWKWQRGSGAQLTWLFVALTRAAGFETYGVWVSDRSNYRFSPRTEDGRWLATNVALVKLKGKELYLDPGSAFVAFGMLPWNETGVSGFKLDKNGGGWVTTTLPDSSQSRIQRSAELRLTDAGDLEGKLTVTFTGLESSQRRAEERFADEVGRKEALEAEVKGWIPTASEVELTNKPDWNSSSLSMVAEFRVKVPNWVSETGSRALLPVGLFGASEKHMFDHANRVHPIYFPFPFQYGDDVNIELPPGWKTISIPESHKQDVGLAVYTSHAANDKNTLQLHRTLKIDNMLVDAKDYPILRNFFQGLRSADEQPVMLQPSKSE